MPAAPRGRRPLTGRAGLPVRALAQVPQREAGARAEGGAGWRQDADESAEATPPEAAKLEAMLARSRVAKSQANLDPTRKAKKADAKKAGTFLTSASSSPSLPPINPQAARSAFAGKSERFDY